MPHPVRLHDPLGMPRHIGVLHGVHPLGPRLRRPNGQYAAPRAHVHHHLVLEQIGIAANGRVVRRHAIVIGEHLLLVVELGVGAEIVGEVGGLGGGVAVVGGDVVGCGFVGKGRVARCG